jgi:hypothetical protein
MIAIFCFFFSCNQDSITLSNRQRYYIRRRGGAPAAIFIAMKKDLLKNEQLYTRHVKKLISEGEQKPHSDSGVTFYAIIHLHCVCT